MGNIIFLHTWHISEKKVRSFSEILETERLLLADYQFENLDDFFKLKSCNEVWKYSSFVPLIEKDQAEILLENLIDERIKGNYVFSALYKKNSKDFIGEAGIKKMNSGKFLDIERLNYLRL